MFFFTDRYFGMDRVVDIVSFAGHRVSRIKPTEIERKTL